MDIDTLIDMLKDYCKDSNKSDDKEIFNSYQQHYLNGYAGVIINSIGDKFEIYTYIKIKIRLLVHYYYGRLIQKKRQIIIIID